MLSRFAAKWRWYDWLFLFIAVIAILAFVQFVAPSSGFAHSVHTAFHALAIGLDWIAAGLTSFASLLNQL